MTPPRHADDITLLCDTAQHLLAERIAKYPAIVTAKGMTQAAADDRIRTMRAVAARHALHRLADLADGMPVRANDLATDIEMRDTLAAASARTAQLAAADPDPATARYAKIVAALLWHAERRLAEQGHWTPDAQAA